MNLPTPLVSALVAYLLFRSSQKAYKHKRNGLWVEAAFFAVVLTFSLGVQFGILKQPIF